MDGEVSDTDGVFPDGSYGPPLHPNCVCDVAISEDQSWIQSVSDQQSGVAALAGVDAPGFAAQLASQITGSPVAIASADVAGSVVSVSPAVTPVRVQGHAARLGRQILGAHARAQGHAGTAGSEVRNP
jgi:hypothetical protein